MINLLPPTVKEQIRYAKMNRAALGYLRVALAVVLVLAGIFGGTFYLLRQQITTIASDVADKQKTVDGLKKTFLPKAQDASQRLNAVKYVQNTQTRFSSLIADVAKVEPQGTSIDTITLTGDDRKPVQIQVSATTYDQALAFRNALVTSPRIAGADIVSITSGNPNPPYNFEAIVAIGFKPGQAR